MPATQDDSRDYVWSTSAIAEGDALKAWVNRLSERITEVDVAPVASAQFSAQWRRFGLGPLDLHLLNSTPQRVTHTAQMARRSSALEYDLIYMRRGRAEVRHRGRTSNVPEGSFVLLENAEAFELIFPDGSVCHNMHIPDTWLRKWVPNPRLAAGRTIGSERPWSRPLASLFGTIDDHGLAEFGAGRSVLADQCGALLGAALSGPKTLNRHQESLLGTVHRRMLDGLGDAKLGPTMVARDCGISKRYLHALFAVNGTTFTTTLTEFRLQQAAETLRDTRFSGYLIGDIAWSCGFTDASHFARRFRARYGQTPQGYRATLP